MLQAMKADCDMSTIILESATHIFNKNSDMLDLSDTHHCNTLNSLNNLENNIVDMTEAISDCINTIADLNKDVTNNSSNITLNMFTEIKQICSSQLGIFNRIMSQTHNANVEFASQKLMHSLCDHNTLFLFTNSDNIPCDGSNSSPSGQNAIEVHLSPNSVILQQALCSTCFHIFCTCCSP